MLRHNLVGETFGQLTVLHRASDYVSPSGFRKPKWACLCSCGRKIDMLRKVLLKPRKHVIASCGCLSRLNESWKISLNALIAGYRDSAFQRKREFDLTDEQCEVFFKGNCHYCGREPFNTFNAYLRKDGKVKSRAKRKNMKRDLESANFSYNGIDRRDNKVGYVSVNCVSCCHPCNMSKGRKTYEEFVGWLAVIRETKHKPNIEKTKEARDDQQ